MEQRPDIKKAGYTIVELMMVMLLLTLFGITMLTLIQSGSTAYEKIADNRSAESDARIALDYLDVRMRQNDVFGAVYVEANPFSEGNALVILETYEGENYYTWIYFTDGTLYECNLLSEGDSPSLDRSEPIAKLIDFTFELEDNAAIVQTATYPFYTANTSEVRTLSSLIVLRSGGALD